VTALPSPRGPLTERLFRSLRRAPGPLPQVPLGDPLDDDAQLALFVLQELTYRPVDGVDDAWEDEPSLLVLRRELEGRLEAVLRAEVPVPAVDDPAAVPEALVAVIAGADGPSLSSWMLDHGTVEHLCEFAVHRAPYQLKEADPHSTAISRLPAGEAKAALLEIQVDEYGPEPAEAHAVLFAETMTALGLDPSGGPDLDRVPASTLLTNTTLGLLASSRRLLPALVGHLAVFEMCSVEPMARYAAAVRRAIPGSAGTRAARFYDVHVVADGRHEVIALDRLVRSFAVEHPAAGRDVLFGGAVLMHVERLMAEHLLACWSRGWTSLRTPLPGSALRSPGPALALVG
jgi:hypothetical protein